ncbi:hypothetical protein QJS10_CPB15g00772 [Acorus calamus]|uniref:Zinc knuckle CX2CX4HX4C domain-containing protein n=1 Tax=Acorus calamus TaxID=4465 RepID=A0AAV9D4Z2_ACOCL|nr:hypothetical protein QJS10_CPB15g00772 [Acorus calamus]
MDNATRISSQIDYARICVEIETLTVLPNEVTVEVPGGDRESFKVIYEWKPDPCAHCHTFGHYSENSCKKPSSETQATESGSQKATKTAQKEGQGPTQAVVIFQTSKKFASKAALGSPPAVVADSHVQGAVVFESIQHSSDFILDHGNVGSVNAYGVSTDPVLKSPQSKSIMSKTIADASAKDQGVDVESFFLTNLFCDSDPPRISWGNVYCSPP